MGALTLARSPDGQLIADKDEIAVETPELRSCRRTASAGLEEDLLRASRSIGSNSEASRIERVEPIPALLERESVWFKTCGWR
jgi:hypothetical protein